MESQLSSSLFPILFTFLLFLLMTLRIIRRQKSKTSNLNLPPGPWKLPLIGNMHLLFGCLPHQRLRELPARYGPVMHLQLGEISHIVISSAEAAKEMMKDNDICFLQRPYNLIVPIISYNYTDVVFAPYGDYWRQVRKICTTELLSVKRVQSYRSIREEAAANLIRSISSAPAGLPVNLIEKLFSFSNDITVKAAFGWRCEDQEAAKRIVRKLTELAGGFSLVDMFPSVKFLELFSGIKSEIEVLQKEFDKIAENIINQHKASRRVKRSSMGDKDEQVDDLVHVLLNLQDQGVTTDNIKAIILDIFLGGSENLSALIEWTMSELLKNPRILKNVQSEVRKFCSGKRNVDEADLQELKYLNLVIKEALRLHPPLPMLFPRECRETCKILGYDIPAGSTVVVNGWAIGRDPEHWTEAEIFYPERFLDSSIDYRGCHFQLIPFGAGRRMCPGVSFAMANVELPLAQMLYHFDWELPDGIQSQDLDMTELFSAVVRRKNSLNLIPVPYHST